MAKLNTEERNKLAEEQFALSGRRYPIHDKSHAQNALARVSQHGSSEEKAQVRKKVCEKHPSMPSCFKDPL